MDPIFSIGVVYDHDWVAIGTQIFSPLCILIAAWYAGSYPKRKDKIEQLNKANFMLGRLVTIDKKFEFFLQSIGDEMSSESKLETRKTVELIRTVCGAFKIEDDISFLTEHEEDIAAHISDPSYVSEVTMSFQLFVFMLTKKLESDEDEYLINYIDDLRKRLNVLYRAYRWTIAQVEMSIDKIGSKGRRIRYTEESDLTKPDL